ADARRAGVDAVLVEIVAEEVHAIRSAQVVVHAAVEIHDRDSARPRRQGADPQLASDVAAVLEWHAGGARGLQGRGARRGLRARASSVCGARASSEAASASNPRRLASTIAGGAPSDSKNCRSSNS